MKSRSQEKTIRDFYQINEILLEHLADTGSTYWISVLNFYEQVADRNVSDLTKGQIGWLTKIVDDLEEKEEKYKHVLQNSNP